MSNLVEIGKTGKPHGVKGELRLRIEGAYLEDALKASVIFIETKGQQLPYFVEQLKIGNAAIVKLEDITRKEDAMLLANATLFLRDEDVSIKVIDADLVFAYLKGYQLEDIAIGVIGTIKTIEEYPQQEMAIVDYKEKEVLIPLHEALIQQIDKAKKVLLMELPEGLLEL